MTFTDYIKISTGNLWRMKLRASLTISGVVIAIAAFISMVSFGAGMQKNINDQFEKLGLLSTIQVYPAKKDDISDTTVAPILNQVALDSLSSIPGVLLAFPYDAFSVSISIADTQLNTNAQALSVAALNTKQFSELKKGQIFKSDSSKQVIITSELTDRLNIDNLDSLIGQTVIITAKINSVDSGLATILDFRHDDTLQPRYTLEWDSLINADQIDEITLESINSLINEEYLNRVSLSTLDSLKSWSQLRSFIISSIDSLINDDYLQTIRSESLDSLIKRDNLFRMISDEIKEAISRFLDGYMNNLVVVSDTFTICGILKGQRHGRTSIEPIIMPVKSASQYGSGNMSNDPTKMLSSLQEGTLFSLSDKPTDTKYFSKITLKIDQNVIHKNVIEAIEKMGFRAFSFVEQFEEIQKFFFYFNMGLGLVGLIALITASLSIINTMVMSIMERRREIGVLKSLGADEKDIRLLFLVESGLIGSIGAVLGIIFGWLITRLASVIAKTYMAKEGIEEIDALEFFDFPVWLILVAFMFGLLVSLAAGLYPASRAARVNPVEALRND
ncbi:MAG: FtsX-like permease family protein [bacterium]